MQGSKSCGFPPVKQDALSPSHDYGSVLRALGSGSSGSIQLVREKSTNELFAVKRTHLTYFRDISKSTDDIYKVAMREVGMVARSDP